MLHVHFDVQVLVLIGWGRSLVVHHQDLLVVPIHQVPSVRLYDVFCNSQMKNPIKLLHHVSELRCCDALLVGLFYVFKMFFLLLSSGMFPRLI